MLVFCPELSEVSATKWVQFVCRHAHLLDTFSCIESLEQRLRDLVIRKPPICDETPRP